LQHESNGQAGLDSRGANTFYIKPIFLYVHSASHIGMAIAPKAWLYIGTEEEYSGDLRAYRGHFELEMAAGRAEGLVLKSRFRWAAEGPSVQLDLTYPLNRLLFDNIDFYFQIQYSNSLAENLINYTERTEALRFGLAIVR
jgi:phospholipase A1